MRVTIKGLTDSTIAFNTLGIVLRGNSSKMEQYPGSVAKSIDIKNDDQLRELITLKNAKLIEYIDENAVAPTVAQTTSIKLDADKKFVKFALPHPQISPTNPSTNPSTKLVFTATAIEDIEDMPSKSNDFFDENELTIQSKKALSKRGRPKGATKAAMKKKADKQAKVAKSISPSDQVVKKIAPKPIKSIKGPLVTSNVAKTQKTSSVSVPVSNSVDGDGNPIDMSAETKENDNYGVIEGDDSHIVIMTPSGPIKGEAINNMAGEMGESEATMASIEALKKLETEENAPDTPVDESKFDDSDKMGGSAVVATGDNKMQKVSMKNSILPESDVVKKKPIQWIDPSGNDGAIKEEKDAKTKNAFLSNDGDVNNTDDSFIEH